MDRLSKWLNIIPAFLLSVAVEVMSFLSPTLQSEIRLLENKKARIEYAQMIKELTFSLYLVSPRKKLNVAIAFVLGILMFTFLAFFLEYIEKNKQQEEE